MSKMLDLGAVSAYALDKEAGYTGTYEEWQLWTSPHVKGGYWWVRDTNTGVPVNGGSVTVADDTAVTPEMYGAVGDGKTDDAPALQKAMESGKPVRLTQDLTIKSRVLVVDKDVCLDGCGYTLHLDGSALSFEDTPDFLAIYAKTITDENSTAWAAAPYAIVREDGDYFHDTFRRGYLSVNGDNPVDEQYEHDTVAKFAAHRAEIRNLVLKCRNFKGFCALTLRKMCHSLVEHVTVLNEEDSLRNSGSVGILVDTSIGCMVRDCYVSGFTDDDSCLVTNRGYGICLNGRDLMADSCTAWDCKHAISLTGNRDYWSTNVKAQNCTFGVHYSYAKRIDGSFRHQQIMDAHAAGQGVRFDNCTIIVQNAGQNGSPIAFAVSAPDVRIHNLNVICDGEACYGSVIGYAQRVYLDGVRGEKLHLQPDSGYYDMREYHINNCLFKRIQGAHNHPIRIYMQDTIVRELMDNVQWVKADNCIFYHKIGWGSHACIKVLDEGIFTGCTIYGHDEETIAPKRSIIEAPANRIRMQGCKIYKRNGTYPIVNTEQADMVGNWLENIFGFYLNEEQGVLGTNELF